MTHALAFLTGFIVVFALTGLFPSILDSLVSLEDRFVDLIKGTERP